MGAVSTARSAEGVGLARTPSPGDPLGSDESCAYDPPGDRAVVKRQRPLAYGQATETALAWTPEARQRLERIPSFVRGVVTSRVEEFARKRGYPAVDLEVMAEVRRSMPVDFSKKLPFFLRSDVGKGSQGEREGSQGETTDV